MINGKSYTKIISYVDGTQDSLMKYFSHSAINLARKLGMNFHLIQLPYPVLSEYILTKIISDVDGTQDSLMKYFSHSAIDLAENLV